MSTVDLQSLLDTLGAAGTFAVLVISVILVILTIVMLILAIRFLARGGTYFKKMTEHVEDEEAERRRAARIRAERARREREEYYDDAPDTEEDAGAADDYDDGEPQDGQ